MLAVDVLSIKFISVCYFPNTQVGRALAVAALDMYDVNPWSRLVLSEHAGLQGVKDWVRRYIRGLRGLPRGTVNKPQRAALKANRYES